MDTEAPYDGLLVQHINHWTVSVSIGYTMLVRHKKAETTVHDCLPLPGSYGSGNAYDNVPLTPPGG